MLSQKCKYAIRAVLHLAVHGSEGQKIPGRQLAEALKIPVPYLSKILQELTLKQILSSVKGPNGGFYLTGKNLDTPLIKIVEAIDGLVFFETCGLGLGDCSNDNPCPIHEEFQTSRDHLKNLFYSKSIGDLAGKIRSNGLMLVR